MSSRIPFASEIGFAIKGSTVPKTVNMRLNLRFMFFLRHGLSGLSLIDS